MNGAHLSSAAWQAVVQGLQQAVWLVDGHSFQVLFANAAAVDLTGRRAEQMVGRPVQELVASPEDEIFWSRPLSEIAMGICSCTEVWNAGRNRAVAVERRVQTVQVAEGNGASQSPLLLLTMLDRSEQEDSRQQHELVLAELRATLDSAADGLLVCDLQGAIRAFNQRFAQLWSLPASLLSRRDDGAVFAYMRRQLADPTGCDERMAGFPGGPMQEAIDVVRLGNGVILEQRSVPQLTHGRLAGRVYSFRDISRQAEVQASLRLAAQVFESSLDAIFIADEQHVILRVNPGCEQLLGVTRSPLAGSAVTALVDAGMDEEAFLAQVARSWGQEGFWEGEVTLRHAFAAGSSPIHLSWVVLRDEGGTVVQSIGFMRDLTQQRAAQRRIEELAFTDALTGLPNRLRLHERVQAAIDAAQGTDDEFAVLFLDLDRFKIVNDSLGHPFGDRVLKLVAQRLQRCLRQSDMLCRLGGDEFLVHLPDSGVQVAEAVARRILEEMLQPFQLDEMHFSIQGSIGIALYPQDGRCLDDLIKHADTAMYRTKERGRGSYGFYQPQMNSNLLARMKMEHAMRQALGQGHMAVHYQPQVDLVSGRIVGAEALLRWSDPQLGAVSPAAFIPLAEESGYIVTLGAWVMEQAAREAAYWQDSETPLVISVNVSALEFRQPGFLQRVAGLVEHHGLRPRQLELELTESVLLQDAQDKEQMLSALARMGVGLSIDDFGTGYSSLAYLKNLPIHRLKVDKSFIDGLPGEGGEAAIVQAIIRMGQALGLEVVAEGVEGSAQREALRAMGCLFYQGYLCAPALPRQQLRDLVLQRLEH
ncbi:sensor domain-containing protein [Pulveribacter suum]|uniref:Diguanylate cyclase n=1 Tax=Pulveribacter suum TaxID=2116657 RepID=A0A2P1NL23_9BURK|nr:EAL domain-containing protein [Pulveribacter suum]AVP57730.1 diguanylate cyclase [Pulveribacter suum]